MTKMNCLSVISLTVVEIRWVMPQTLPCLLKNMSKVVTWKVTLLLEN